MLSQHKEYSEARKNRADLYSLDNTCQLDVTKITNLGLDDMHENHDEDKPEDTPEDTAALALNRPKTTLSPDQMVVFNWASPASIFIVAYQISILYFLLGLYWIASFVFTIEDRG